MVRFFAEHRFPATRQAVAEVLGDGAFYEDLELPDLCLLEVQRDAADGLVLRYEFTGNLDPIALRLLGGARPTWTQVLQLRGTEGGLLTFSAESNPRVLHGRADFTLHPDGEGTSRQLEGDLVVAVPVVGSVAARRIVPGVLRRLDVEADAVRRRLETS